MSHKDVLDQKKKRCVRSGARYELHIFFLFFFRKVSNFNILKTEIFSACWVILVFP